MENRDIAFHHNPLSVRQSDVNFINSLPPELLSQIFELGSADASSIPSNRWIPFEITVSHVCRHWRTIALSTPLWSTIKLSLEARPLREPERVSMLLERSKGALIDIYCNFDDHTDDEYFYTDEHFDHIGRMISMLTPHIHRWRTMELTVCDNRYMDSFFSAISAPSISAASQLTTLELYNMGIEGFTNGIRVSTPQNLARFCGSAPLLTSLVLWAVHIDWSLPWIAFVPNLERLELAFYAEEFRPSWAQFTFLLRSTSALKHLSLRQSGPSGDPAEWFIEPTPGSPSDLNGPIHLPHVTEFILAHHSEAYAIALLRNFHLPAVKTLGLEFSRGNYANLILELAGPATFLFPVHGQRPSLLSRIENLNIQELPCQISSIQTLYSELHNLTSLSLTSWQLPNMFLGVLCIPCTPRRDVWLPRLVRLRVRTASGNILRELVARRAEAGVPLERLEVGQFNNEKEEVVEWLKKNVKTFKFHPLLAG